MKRRKKTVQLIQIFLKAKNLQGYDISISAGNMRPTKARAYKMIIPISNLMIGIIQCP